MATIESTTVLETTICPTCAMQFAMPERFLKERRSDGKNFYCPSGHGQAFNDSEIEKLKKQLQQVNAAKDQVHAELRDTTKKLRAQKGQVTKSRNQLARLKSGLCPCCDQQFTDLKTHIAAEHPDFIPETDQDGDESKVGASTETASKETKTAKEV